VNNGFKQELAAIAEQYKAITDKDVPAMTRCSRKTVSP